MLNFKALGMTAGGKKLFEGLNFNFERKRKLGIIGRNGLGKTTLLRIILGRDAGCLQEKLRSANGRSSTISINRV